MHQGRYKLLEWFRYFVYTDLKAIGNSEALKLWFEFDSIVRTGFFEDQIINTNDLTVRLISDFRAKLIDSQSWFSQKFHSLMKKIEQIPEREIKKWASDKECGFEGFGLIRSNFPHVPEPFLNDLLPAPSIKTQFNITAYVPIKPDHRGEGDKAEARWNPRWREEATVRVSFMPEDQDNEALLLVFLRAINGIKINAFKRCLECGQWFFHFSKREKFYCSNKCAARKGNRERRAKIKKENGKEYEKEKAKSKKRAKESYKRKVKAKSGPNVKITRRPRKK